MARYLSVVTTLLLNSQRPLVRGTMRGMAETDGIATALGQLSDDDLERLRAAADSSPDIVPGLLAYLDHTGDWEQHRRRGVDFKLEGPMAALEDDQTEAALAALRVLSARFRASRQRQRLRGVRCYC
jgi:hypothetical protein